MLWWSFSTYSWIIYVYNERFICGWLQILYILRKLTNHHGPEVRASFFKRHTFSDIGHLFMMVISENVLHVHSLPPVAEHLQKYNYLFLKGFKCWPLFGTHGHWAMSVLFFSVPHLLWHRASVNYGNHEDLWRPHLMPSVWRWCCHYPFLRLSLSRLGFVHPTFRKQGNRFNRLCLRDDTVIIVNDRYRSLPPKNVLLFM